MELSQSGFIQALTGGSQAPRACGEVGNRTQGSWLAGRCPVPSPRPPSCQVSVNRLTDPVIRVPPTYVPEGLLQCSFSLLTRHLSVQTSEAGDLDIVSNCRKLAPTKLDLGTGVRSWHWMSYFRSVGESERTRVDSAAVIQVWGDENLTSWGEGKQWVGWDWMVRWWVMDWHIGNESS